eukprot:3044328-Amphidinium_carterae.1
MIESCSDIQAPKRGKVAFIWWKSPESGYQLCKLLRERKIKAPSGKPYWSSPTRPPQEVTRSSKLGRAAALIREHLDDQAVNTESLDVLYRSGRIVYGKSIIAELKGDEMVINEEGWAKECHPLSKPQLS